MLYLKEESIKWAINHINKYNDTYIFPRPFEFDAINDNLDEVINHIKGINISDFGIQTYRTEITPKSQVGFRISTQLDPVDSIIYNAVLYEIIDDIECNRVACTENIVYSYRLKADNDGTLYDGNYNWEAFNKRAKEIVGSDKYSYVIVTDIADYFSSIYLHNLETCLKEAVSKGGRNEHANVLIKLIKGMHNSQTHKGLPIGPQFSRPLSELIMDEIDDILINKGIKFIRYVDDIRIFCNSETEAYKNLAYLAQKLYDLRNLKLNESKTKILKVETFNNEYLEFYKDKEKKEIFKNFYELCDKLGIDTSSYDDVDISELSLEEKEELEELNIIELLKEETSKEEMDLGLVKFLLNNLARFDNTEAADIFLAEENIVKVFPILNTFINYLERVRTFSSDQKHYIGRKVLDLFNKSYITELQFNRAWLLNLFTKNQEWNNKETFANLINKFDDEMTRRELILCLGRASYVSYFREKRQKNTLQMTSWERRAFSAGISCLPKDERKGWYNSQKLKHREFLDEIVEKWAFKKHF